MKQAGDLWTIETPLYDRFLVVLNTLNTASKSYEGLDLPMDVFVGYRLVKRLSFMYASPISANLLLSLLCKVFPAKILVVEMIPDEFFKLRHSLVFDLMHSE